jgi:acyl dehydratase
LFAKEVAGYPGVFAHGMLTMGATGRIVTDWMGDDRLLTYGVRFVKQVWPGDTLTARAEITAISARDGLPVAELSVITSNQDGTSVLVGTAVARLDG